MEPVPHTSIRTITHSHWHAHDNLLIYRVNLPAPNAAPKEVRWLGSSGEVVRRITSR